MTTLYEEYITEYVNTCIYMSIFKSYSFKSLYINQENKRQKIA